jgi:molybdate transport system substrate-binding protein
MFKMIFCSLFLFLSTALAETSLCIFSAAGTAPAMKEIAAEFTRQTGTPVVFNFANAGVLARQIIAGVPFDLFFSANDKWMDVVADAGAIDPATRIVLLEDELVIIVPRGQPVVLDFSKPWKNETFAGRFATGDSSTPLGIYAREAFTNLGWWEPLQPHLCVGDTANKALTYVALGEADAGVVFRSIASCAAGRVDIVAGIPARLHHAVHFPIAAATGASPAALRFLQEVQSETAAGIFKKYGWTIWHMKK